MDLSSKQASGVFPCTRASRTSNKQRPRTDKVLRRTACQGLCAPETPLKGVINMISFFVGVMVGGIVGVFFMALVNASYNEREDE